MRLITIVIIALLPTQAMAGGGGFTTGKKIALYLITRSAASLPRS